jgi:HAE1 family hydrophobic/amphiphilic exporter-1/multidrug efflux pump
MAIAERANKALAGLRAGQAIAFIPPAIVELGNATGFDMQLVDVGRVGRSTDRRA